MQILRFVLLVAAVCGGSVFAEEKTSFRLLFSNDTTNIVSCPSPFNPKAGPFREEFLRAEVDEATAADIQLLQPGLGWVPWWKSDVLPMDKHVQWLNSKGKKPNSFDQYVLDGGDLIRIFIEECRKKGVSPYISLRMNDMHHVYRGWKDIKPRDQDDLMKRMSEFAWFDNHQDWLLGPRADRDRRAEFAFDFSRRDVVKYRLEFIKEIASGYDIDGFELDFMRHRHLFHPERTGPKKRIEIMTWLIREARMILDETAKNGQKRKLCVRIPAYPALFDGMGIDLSRWAEAGVDIFILSGGYFSDMLVDLSAFRQSIPQGKECYPELHYVVASRPKKLGENGPSINVRASERQIATATYLACKRGVSGVSFFNFHYYRGTKNPNDVSGEAAEPPFDLLGKLKDVQWLQEQPQQYVAARTFYHADVPRLFSVAMAPEKTTELSIDMVPPVNGWKKNAKLRIRANVPLKPEQWKLAFNGRFAEQTEDVSNPLSSDESASSPEEYLAWTIPIGQLKDGKNKIELTLTAASSPVHVYYLDIIVP